MIHLSWILLTFTHTDRIPIVLPSLFATRTTTFTFPPPTSSLYGSDKYVSLSFCFGSPILSDDTAVLDELLSLNLVPILFRLLSSLSASGSGTEHTQAELNVFRDCCRIMIQVMIHTDCHKWQGSFSDEDFASLLISNYFVC